jgi:hypothetical protein
MWNRRDFFASCALRLTVPALAQRTQQRVVVLISMDLGSSTWTKATCQCWRGGGNASVPSRQDTMPSVTNNASICCGVLPEQHGIRGVHVVEWMFTFAAAAYDLVRMSNLMAKPVGAL